MPGISPDNGSSLQQHLRPQACLLRVAGTRPHHARRLDLPRPALKAVVGCLVEGVPQRIRNR